MLDDLSESEGWAVVYRVAGVPREIFAVSFTRAHAETAARRIQDQIESWTRDRIAIALFTIAPWGILVAIVAGIGRPNGPRSSVRRRRKRGAERRTLRDLLAGHGGVLQRPQIRFIAAPVIAALVEPC